VFNRYSKKTTTRTTDRLNIGYKLQSLRTQREKKKKRKEKNVELNVIGMNSQYIYNNKEKKEEN